MEQQCELPYRQNELVDIWMYSEYYYRYTEVSKACFRLKNWDLFVVVLSYQDLLEEDGDYIMYAPIKGVDPRVSHAVFLVNNREAVLVCNCYDEDLIDLKLSRSRRSLVVKTRDLVSRSPEHKYEVATHLFDLKTGLER